MATRKPYWELLRDPRWQKKRLEVMQEADFTCEECGAKDRTLNVHHKLYRKGADPWDYAQGELQCLCEPCHQSVSNQAERLKEVLALLSRWDLAVVCGYAMGRVQSRRFVEESDLSDMPGIPIASYPEAYGFAAGLLPNAAPCPPDFLQPIIPIEIALTEWQAAMRKAGAMPDESPEGEGDT